ncbi:hypothetical protein R1flu_025982 [Riccia fluitans]|uniref:Replitron HUH endonuclease domain-containing protein n=1 Tax=Riccia fluitans TaxID=41844 RepID=A0ABD1XF82_9MARC
MQTIRYSVPRPWPEAFSLVEAVKVKKSEFSPTKVTEHVGRVGIIPRTWNKEKQDWYVDILEFVCIRTVQRQKEKVLGSFRIRKSRRCSAAQRSGSGRSDAIAKPWKDGTMYIRQELAREVMKRNCQEHEEMEKTRQQQILSKERKEARHMVNENGQEAAKANQTKAAKKPRRVPEKMFDVSLTIGIPGENVDEKLFDLLVKWLEYRAEMAVLALERGDAFLQLHLQGMMRVKTSSTRILKREIKEVIGWESNPPVGGSVCLKSLREKGLHIVIGLIGYCLKDEGAAHFKFYSKNITEEQKAEGRRMHSIYGASEYKHKLELTPANILGRALQFRKYRVKNPLSITFRRCIAEMLRSGTLKPKKRRRLQKDDANIHEESELPGQSRAGDDEDASTIPLVELDKPVNSGADLQRVREALLQAGFAVEKQGAERNSASTSAAGAVLTVAFDDNLTRRKNQTSMAAAALTVAFDDNVRRQNSIKRGKCSKEAALTAATELTTTAIPSIHVLAFLIPENRCSDSPHLLPSIETQGNPTNANR